MPACELSSQHLDGVFYKKLARGYKLAHCLHFTDVVDFAGKLPCRVYQLASYCACVVLYKGLACEVCQPANYLHYMNTVLYREDRLYVCPIEQIVFIAWLAIVLYREAILWLPCTWPPMHRRCCDLQKS